jgi:hypothetical protein
VTGSPTRAITVGVALLALALMGVPFFFGRRLPESLERGLVVDGRGFGVADAAVYLFSEEHLQLVEETRTDEDGDFAFHLEAERPRIFVQPPEGQGLLPAWNPPAEATSGPQSFVLARARELAVRVRDLADAPVAGAEVRVYEASADPSVLSLAVTDAEGLARIAAPAQAHVAVFAPGATPLARWRFDVAVPEAGGELFFALPPGRWLRGHVRDANGPLADIVLVSWEEGPEGGWNGFTHSDSEGAFALPCSAGPTEVRALDPAGRVLPQRLRLTSGSEEPLELVLAPGASLVVRTTRKGLPIGARVWSWSPEAEAWGWGQRTSASGRARVSVGSRYGIRAEPFDPALAPLEAWDVPFEEGLLSLESSALGQPR